MNPTTFKKLDPIARKIGFYTSYTLDEAEHIGDGKPAIVRQLREGGYESPPTFAGIPLAAAKEHPETGQVHDYTFRKVDTEKPRMQYHVHLWYKQSAKDVEIYSHYEFRPDFKPVGEETTGEMIERLRTHYRPVYGDDYVQGKADESVRELVE